MSELLEIASSKSRLEIAALLSDRPRTLRELARKTGISVQAVLKHLSKLKQLGLLEEREITASRLLTAKKHFRLKSAVLANFARGGLLVVDLARAQSKADHPESQPWAEMEAIAEDIVVQRGRIANQVRRLEKQIGRLAESRMNLRSEIDALALSEEEKLLCEVLLTEADTAAAEKALSQDYGCHRPSEAIREVITKVTTSGGKGKSTNSNSEGRTVA